MFRFQVREAVLENAPWLFHGVHPKGKRTKNCRADHCNDSCTIVVNQYNIIFNIYRKNRYVYLHNTCILDASKQKLRSIHCGSTLVQLLVDGLQETFGSVTEGRIDGTTMKLAHAE